MFMCYVITPLLLSPRLSRSSVFLNFSNRNSSLEKYRWRSVTLEKSEVAERRSGKIRGSRAAFRCASPYFDRWWWLLQWLWHNDWTTNTITGVSNPITLRWLLHRRDNFNTPRAPDCERHTNEWHRVTDDVNSVISTDIWPVGVNGLELLARWTATISTTTFTNRLKTFLQGEHKKVGPLDFCRYFSNAWRFLHDILHNS